ncbi:YpmS family protein [Psychrobacillus sp. NPDC096623]|uniref:YpmS family protein n=1 Tax=Psychrobacillus sp. NPDC096623 TaxID=3364492 RepID=UPI00380907E7
MNIWKIAFILLVVVIIGSIGTFFYWITTPAEPIVIEETSPSPEGNVLTVNATKEDFQAIANTYLKKAIGGKPLPLQISVDDQVVLSSEFTAFSINLPVRMFFEPYVEENGNIRLEQSSVEIGQLQLDPETILKLLRDSVELPNWMVVNPAEEEVLIQLSEIPMTSGVRVRAKELNLAEDIITLEIVIPKE